MIAKYLLARTCPEPSAPPISRARHPRCVIERRLRLCNACHLCPQSFSVAFCLTVAEIQSLLAIMFSETSSTPGPSGIHTSLVLMALPPPQSHWPRFFLKHTRSLLPSPRTQQVPHVPLDSSPYCLTRRGSTSPRASASSDLVYCGLFSSSGCIYVWHILYMFIFISIYSLPKFPKTFISSQS